MKRRIITEFKTLFNWCSGPIGNRSFSLFLYGEKQDYSFTLNEKEVEKLEQAILDYRKMYPK